jgi:hypothetical protein
VVDGILHPKAGEIHGYASDAVQFEASEQELDILDVHDHCCILSDTSVDVPADARAWNEQMELKVSASTSDNVQSIDNVFRLIECSDKPSLIVDRIEDDTLQLERMDQFVSGKRQIWRLCYDVSHSQWDTGLQAQGMRRLALMVLCNNKLNLPYTTTQDG